MKRLLAIALLLAVAVVPTLAAETSPWALAEQNRARREDLGRIPRFCAQRGTEDISASDAWLWQGRISGVLINLRLFAPDGSGRLFQEQLRELTPGTSDLRLDLRTRTKEGGLMLQLDEKALTVLRRSGVREIRVADGDYFLQASYKTADLHALREAFGLGAQEQLCVGGPEDPVMVVDATGRRRYARP